MRGLAVVALLMFVAVRGLGFREVLGQRRADDAYRAADRLFRAGDLYAARESCGLALLWNDRHASGFALRTRIDIHLGRSPVPAFDLASMLARMDDAFERADRGQDPKGELRKILEYAKWLPRGAEVEWRVDRARLLLHPLEGCWARSGR